MRDRENRIFTNYPVQEVRARGKKKETAFITASIKSDINREVSIVLLESSLRPLYPDRTKWTYDFNQIKKTPQGLVEALQSRSYLGEYGVELKKDPRKISEFFSETISKMWNYKGDLSSLPIKLVRIGKLLEDFRKKNKSEEWIIQNACLMHRLPLPTKYQPIKN